MAREEEEEKEEEKIQKLKARSRSWYCSVSSSQLATKYYNCTGSLTLTTYFKLLNLSLEKLVAVVIKTL